eukprot:7049938-Prymnesium_polylepis.1
MPGSCGICGNRHQGCRSRLTADVGRVPSVGPAARARTTHERPDARPRCRTHRASAAARLLQSLQGQGS